MAFLHSSGPGPSSKRPTKWRAWISWERYSLEEIVTKFRHVKLTTTERKAIAVAVKTIGVTETTLYRWPSEYGGLNTDQVTPFRSAQENKYSVAPRDRRADAREIDLQAGGGRTIQAIAFGPIPDLIVDIYGC